MSIKSNIRQTVCGYRRISKNLSAIKKGQSNNYSIFQTSHRLEKGMCMSSPKPMWGYDKAMSLVGMLNKEISSTKPDKTAIKVGASVLTAFVAEKEKCSDVNEQNKVKKLKEMIKKTRIPEFADKNAGGALLLKKEAIIPDPESSENLFRTRHSVRDFSDTPVDREKLEKAVELALTAPSACNRQATQIYVISGKDRKKVGAGNEYNADMYLIMTGNMKAFAVSELNDWIVSTCVFCGYLSLALHAMGIGSCFFRKETIRNSKYNNAIRKMCNIPDDEQIVLEMAIGNYKDEFKAAVSYRKKVKDIIHYINKRESN